MTTKPSAKVREFWIYSGVNENEPGFDKAYGNRSAVYKVKPSVASTCIHVVELPPGARVITREMLREAFEKHASHVVTGGPVDTYVADSGDVEREIFGKDEAT